MSARAVLFVVVTALAVLALGCHHSGDRWLKLMPGHNPQARVLRYVTCGGQGHSHFWLESANDWSTLLYPQTSILIANAGLGCPDDPRAEGLDFAVYDFDGRSPFSYDIIAYTQWFLGTDSWIDQAQMYFYDAWFDMPPDWKEESSDHEFGHVLGLK